MKKPMTSLSLLCVGVLLGAGLAFAKAPKTPSPPPAPPAKKAPQTCDDQCEFLETSCTDPCKKMKKGSAQAKAACSANCQQIAKACYGSCKEKGRIDGQYIMEHIRPPKAPGGGQQGGAEE
jgi:hypothetical protein